MTPSEIKAALSERHTIALTLKHEAVSELVPGVGWKSAPVEHRVAVACVIRNRVRTPRRFGQTFKDVCLKPHAFSCWLPNGERNFESLMARAELFVLDGDASLFAKGDAILRECLWIADGLLADAFSDRVAGATHYYADWLRRPPAWSFHDQQARTRPIEPVAVIGSHRFYRGIR